jgi:flagellin-like protein
MKKLLKSRKALSPVVAAIILIAVTVAVSIAVAAWMGSLTFTFMETEELKITSVTFSSTSNTTLTVKVQNTGTTDVAIVTDVTVTGYNTTGGTTPAATVEKGGTGTFSVTLNTGESWGEGKTYTVELLSTKGNKFTYTDTAPA